jgi:hypothetical protein
MFKLEKDLFEQKLNEFIKSLNNRFIKHVSNEFIKAYILGEFKNIIIETPNISLEDVAYKSSVYLFESLLEHGCIASCNGHHVAQYFASYFKDIKIEYKTKDILIEIKKSVIRYCDPIHDDNDGVFETLNWFLFFISNKKISDWVVIEDEDGEIEELELENFEILEITNEYFIFCGGGDWQEPHKVKMTYKENNVYYMEDLGEDYKKGLSPKEFCEKLGLKYDEKECMIIHDNENK